MTDPGKKAKLTMRAEILSKVLDCIYLDDYDDFGRYLIFGGSLDDLLWDADHPGQADADDKIARARAITQAVGEAAVDIHVHRGRNSVRRRASLDGPAKEGPTIRGLGRLEDLGAGGIADALRDAPDAHKILESASEKSEREMDELDAYFAKEVLVKLSKIVHRISRLDDLDIQGIRDERVRKYFEEAHRCYLYGFPVACAVLCRAILESALVEVIDPDRRIDHSLTEEMRKSGKPKQSYIERLIDEAANKNILPDDRPKCAIEVRDAGNEGIHDYEKFEERLRDPFRGLANIVDSTRKILIDLYSQ